LIKRERECTTGLWWYWSVLGEEGRRTGRLEVVEERRVVLGWRIRGLRSKGREEKG